MNKKRLLLIIISALFISGCATTEYIPPSVRVPSKQGVYHKVRKGETLWRISKAYQVDMNEIIVSNRIPNVAYIEEDQLIFIPGATAVKEIPLTQKNTNKDEFDWPVKGKVVYYFNSGRDQQGGSGIGIRSFEGEIVKASREGRVIFADYLSGYAYTVVIDHLDNYFSVYSQNAALTCKVGDYKYKGDSVARIGRQSDSAYLHFEIRKHSVAQNPLYFLPQ